MGIGLLVPFAIYAVRFGEASSCRLTYADDAVISESEMQSWMADERWPLSVPTYDWKRRTCVCRGFEDKDPKSLLPADEVLVWIAPGDLASLSDERAITPALPATFLDKYRGAYGEKDHVKVCLRQQLVLDLWNYDPSTINVADGGRHCHVSSGDGSSNVEQLFLGWDGALYCLSEEDQKKTDCAAKVNIDTTQNKCIQLVEELGSRDATPYSVYCSGTGQGKKGATSWCSYCGGTPGNTFAETGGCYPGSTKPACSATNECTLDIQCCTSYSSD
jgi:hypothetical protein